MGCELIKDNRKKHSWVESPHFRRLRRVGCCSCQHTPVCVHAHLKNRALCRSAKLWDEWGKRVRGGCRQMESSRGWKASIQKWGNGVNISQVSHLGLNRETFDSLGIRVAYISQLKAPWFATYYLVAQMVKNLPAVQETWVRSLSLEDPQRREWLPTPVFLPGEFHGQRSLAGYCPQGHKESDRTKQLILTQQHMGGFPGGSVVKNLPASAADMNLISGLGRSHMPWNN